MKTVTFAAPTWNRSESYGRIACEGRDYFMQQGYIVNTIGDKSPDLNFIPTYLNVLHGYPTNFDQFGAIANFGVQVVQSAWESTVLPPLWAENLNRCSALLVPCQWNAEVFKDGGVTIPIQVVAEGVSDDFRYAARKQRDLFRFVAIGDRGQRKGFVEAISAFVRAFGDRDDVELVIKSRSLLPNSPLLNLLNKNIRVINEDYSDAEMSALYADCDCMIFPAHGEGFALPPREFAATGGIALATNYGGMADEIEQWGIPLEYELVSAWPFHDKFAGLGLWPDADMDDLTDKLRWVRDLSLAERNKMGKRFSNNALRLYQWSEYGRRLLETVLQYEHEFEKAALENSVP